MLRTQLASLLLTGLLALGAAPSGAQETPTSQPAPAPEVNVNVAPAPPAPPSTVIVEQSQPAVSTNTSTNVSTSETKVLAPATAGFDPWVLGAFAVGGLVLIVLMASAFRGRSSSTSVTSVR